MTRLVHASLAVAFGLVVALLLGELVLRVSGTWIGRHSDTMFSVITHDERLGWKMPPNISRRVDFVDVENIAVRSNSDGFWDAEFLTEKPSGLCRVAFLGDSFTWGMGVREEDRFSNRIPSIDALNFGMPAFGTDQALLAWEHEARRFKPDVAVLTVYENDYYDNVHEIRYGRAKPFFEASPHGLVLKNVPVAGKTFWDHGVYNRIAAPYADLYDVPVHRRSRLLHWLAKHSDLVRLAYRVSQQGAVSRRAERRLERAGRIDPADGSPPSGGSLPADGIHAATGSEKGGMALSAHLIPSAHIKPSGHIKPGDAAPDGTRLAAATPPLPDLSRRLDKSSPQCSRFHYSRPLNTEPGKRRPHIANVSARAASASPRAASLSPAAPMPAAPMPAASGLPARAAADAEARYAAEPPVSSAEPAGSAAESPLPIAEPPVSEPPVSEPPVSEPPVSEPPLPPAEQSRRDLQLRLIQTLRDSVDAAGARLIVVFAGKTHPTVLADMGALREAGISVVDATTDAIRPYLHGPVYFPYNQHWTAPAHAAAADLIAGALHGQPQPGQPQPGQPQQGQTSCRPPAFPSNEQPPTD